LRNIPLNGSEITGIPDIPGADYLSIPKVDGQARETMNFRLGISIFTVGGPGVPVGWKVEWNDSSYSVENHQAHKGQIDKADICTSLTYIIQLGV